MESIRKERPSKVSGDELVLRGMKRLIAVGEWKEGDRLPSEEELSERFHVSKASVHRALKAMENMGILDKGRGDGLYVRQVTLADLIRRLDLSVPISLETMINLQELRIHLETYAAYRAALHRTEEDLSEIRRVLSEMRMAKRDPDQESEAAVTAMQKRSHQFHTCLIQAAHSDILSGIYNNLYESLDISRQFAIGTSSISFNSILAHETVFRHILERDARGARDAMSEHLEDLQEQLTALSEGREVPILESL